MENNENNVQNQEKKQSKGLSVGLVVIMLIAVLIIGVGGGYLLSKNGNLFNKNETKPNNTIEQTKTSKKIDESKPWVYDANYANEKESKVIGKSDDGYYDETTKESLKMPFININSNDAETVNASIKKIFEEAYKEFGENGEHGGKVKIETSYEYYENGNILSVVIKKRYGIVPGGSSTDLYTFNFNIETLKTATLSEMAKACGFNSEEEVTNKIHQWVGRQNEIAKSNPDKVAAQMMGVSDGLYFIDKNNKLNFIYLCAATGNYDTPAVVEPNKEIEDFYDFANGNTQQNQTTLNNNSSTTTSDYNTAITEIKKCLKDVNWLKEKEMSGGYEPYNEESTIKSYFAKLNSVNNKPYYVILSKVFDSSYLRIVSYDGKEVTVNGHCGADYGDVKIDIDNNVVEVSATMFVAYYKIANGNFELLERANNSGDGIDEERTKLEEKYRKNYNFVSIDTKLNNQNIDTYVK